MKDNQRYYLIIVLVLILGAAVYFLISGYSPKAVTNSATVNAGSSTASPSPTPIEQATSVGAIMSPISDALSRVTKKPFGIKITPQTSPVQPERFSGYHTGADFETTASEQDTDVPVYAICDGTLALKKSASGYGGVAVESCQIGGEDVTVVYGHLRLSSISANTGQTFAAGEQIGLLGKGGSTETDGERKHLHLGIHKGKIISLLGYVQTSAELSGWIDPMTLLK